MCVCVCASPPPPPRAIVCYALRCVVRALKDQTLAGTSLWYLPASVLTCGVCFGGYLRHFPASVCFAQVNIFGFNAPEWIMGKLRTFCCLVRACYGR